MRPENYGRGQETIEFLDRQEVMESLLSTFHSPSYEPPVLPATAIELLALSRKANVEFPQISALLEKDPLVAAKVLKIAQSAMYARGAAVTSLNDAVVRLGLETVAGVFLQVTMNLRVFRAPGFEKPMTALRRHSAMTAQVARIVCRKTSVYDEYAFLCGLLHDVGIAAGAAALGTSVPFDVAWPAILEAHAEAGRVLCSLWNLPPDVALVVGVHHGSKPGSMLHPVACAVTIADWVAQKLSYRIDGDESPLEPVAELKALGISQQGLTEILGDAKKIAAKVDAI